MQTYRSVFIQVEKLHLFCLYFGDCLNLKPFVSKMKRVFCFVFLTMFSESQLTISSSDLFLAFI